MCMGSTLQIFANEWIAGSKVFKQSIWRDTTKFQTHESEQFKIAYKGG